MFLGNLSSHTNNDNVSYNSNTDICKLLCELHCLYSCLSTPSEVMNRCSVFFPSKVTLPFELSIFCSLWFGTLLTWLHTLCSPLRREVHSNWNAPSVGHHRWSAKRKPLLCCHLSLWSWLRLG